MWPAAHKQSFYRARMKRDFKGSLNACALPGNHFCRIPSRFDPSKVELDTAFCNIDFRFY